MARELELMIAREMCTPELLQDTEAFLRGRLDVAMKVGETDRVRGLGRALDKIDQVRRKKASNGGER